MVTRTRHLILFATVLVLLASAVGCGGGGGTTSAGTPAAGEEVERAASEGPKTQAQLTFIKEANALCAKATDQFEQELQPYFKKGLEANQESESIVEGLLVPSIEAEIEGIRALGPPAGDSSQVEAILTALDEVAEQAQADPEAFVVKGGFYAESMRLAEEYGVGDCGSL
jgi:hypothetical protein